MCYFSGCSQDTRQTFEFVGLSIALCNAHAYNVKVYESGVWFRNERFVTLKSLQTFTAFFSLLFLLHTNVVVVLWYSKNVTAFEILLLIQTLRRTLCSTCILLRLFRVYKARACYSNCILFKYIHIWAFFSTLHRMLSAQAFINGKNGKHFNFIVRF